MNSTILLLLIFVGVFIAGLFFGFLLFSSGPNYSEEWEDDLNELADEITEIILDEIKK